MTAADVLAQSRAAGVELLIHDGRLASRGRATPELRDAIRAHRHDLAALLTGKPHHFCRHCNRTVVARELVDIGHDVLLHHACGRVVRCPA